MINLSSREEYSLEPKLTEEEMMRKDIEKAYRKLNRSWNNFMNAEKEYIDIAIMEIYNDELRISILIRKLKTLLSETDDIEHSNILSRELPWLK